MKVDGVFIIGAMVGIAFMMLGNYLEVYWFLINAIAIVTIVILANILNKNYQLVRVRT